MRSSRLVLPPIRLVASATAISRVGKNARKRLKAMAWEITPHRGNTRANIPYVRLRIPAAEIIARHYTCLSQPVPESAEPHRPRAELTRPAARAPASSLFFHVDHWKCFTVYQGNGDAFHSGISFYTKELGSGQRRSHLIPAKARGLRGIFAGQQDHAANSAARPIRMDEESANFRCIMLRAQQCILALCPMIAAVECLALAPAAASDDD